MKYKFIRGNCFAFPVGKMCQTFKVSRSSYYGWEKRGKSKRGQEDEALLLEIKKVYERSRGRYGSPRITAELREKGVSCSHNRIARLMKENKIMAKTKRRFKVTTKSNHEKAIAGDLLQQGFMAKERNQVWASDITYIWTNEGWLYLAVILDIYSRKIVGWALERYLRSDIVKKALLKALAERNPGQGLIFHSDQGIQYASNEIVKILKAHEIRQSMSSRGNCYGNAITETFFHTIKTEHIFFESYETRESARLSIFEYIEIFYNRERRHSALGYKSPEKFEQLTYGGNFKAA